MTHHGTQWKSRKAETTPSLPYDVMSYLDTCLLCLQVRLCSQTLEARLFIYGEFGEEIPEVWLLLALVSSVLQGSSPLRDKELVS